jgi:hypothetical protein
MEKLNNQEQAIDLIRAVQTDILKAAQFYTSFHFSIYINQKSEIQLGVARGFYLEDYNRQGNELKFTGKSLEEATQKFLDFFLIGGRARVRLDEDGDQFKADFFYKDGWIVENTHVGHYSYHGD